MKSTFLVVLLCLGMSGCAITAKSTKKGKRVRVMKSAPRGCKFIEDIHASDRMWARRVNGRIKFKNRAAEVGGNVAVLDTVGHHLHQGRAYKCPKKIFETL